jgi:cbb3-type cytochrome oxidase maturation protein
MNILYLLIPLALVLLGIAIWAFMWAVRSGQFDDLEGPAHRILMDDDDPLVPMHPPSANDEPAGERRREKP